MRSETRHPASGCGGTANRWTSSPPLPLPLANCATAALNGRTHVFGGQQSPRSAAAESGLYSLDLNNPGAAWRAEPPLPGSGRILPSVAATAGALFVAGGADLRPDANGNAARSCLRDAWQFTPGAGWRALPDLPAPFRAAPAFGLNGRFFVLGGSDGELAPRENELRDAHPGFSRSLYACTAKRGWRIAAKLRFSLVTTTPAIWKDLIVLPGGEDQPAHRSAEVYGAALNAIGA